MGLFDKLKMGKVQSSQEERQFDNDLLEIVRIVSFNNMTILKSAQECIENTSEFYKNHIIDYEERGLSSEDENSYLQWIGCVDLLLSNNYVCECDWKENKDEFVSNISTLQGMNLLSLKINNKWFDEGRQITQWCATLDDKWKKSNCVLAAFDIDSDSYVMFICKLTDMETLSALADSFGYRIDYAKNM